MATITPTVVAPPGFASSIMNTLTLTTLTGTADTFIYNPTVPGSMLIMINPTGASISATITGSTAPFSLLIPNLQTFNTSSGFNVGSIAAGASRGIALDAIAQWLKGTITITGGAGLTCYLLTLS